MSLKKVKYFISDIKLRKLSVRKLFQTSDIRGIALEF